MGNREVFNASDMGILCKIKRARNVICDFDGVVADSEEFQLGIWGEILQERGFPRRSLTVQNIAGIPDRQAIEESCPGYSEELYASLITEKKSRYAEQADQISLVPGIRAFLESVQGVKDLFICSGSTSADVARFVANKLPDLS